MNRIILSSEQRGQVEFALTAVTKAQTTLDAKGKALDAARQLQADFDTDVAKRKSETDVRDKTAVSALIVAERQTALNSEQLPMVETELVEARQAVAAVMQPVPDVLRSILSPIFEQTVAAVTRDFLPQFKDSTLARNAAIQTSRVQNFRQFISCYWVVEPSHRIATAPLAIGWLESLLSGELPQELAQ